MNYRDRPWPEGGPGGHMDPYTAPGPQPSMSTNATAEVALRRAKTLTSPTAWAGFSRQEIEAIREHARQEGRAEIASDLDRTIDERDNYHEWADQLAQAIAPAEEIGEHTSTNNPWRNALAHQDQVLAILHSALGERPGSVVEGVRALIDALAENKRAVADVLAEARRQGAEQEREHLARTLIAKVNAPDALHGVELRATVRALLTEFADDMLRGAWSGEEVDDG